MVQFFMVYLQTQIYFVQIGNEKVYEHGLLNFERHITKLHQQFQLHVNYRNYLASYQQSHNYQIIKKRSITNSWITNKRQVYQVQLFNLNFFNTSLLGLVHTGYLYSFSKGLSSCRRQAMSKMCVKPHIYKCVQASLSSSSDQAFINFRIPMCSWLGKSLIVWPYLIFICLPKFC